jgi:hypothetical protein
VEGSKRHGAASARPVDFDALIERNQGLESPGYKAMPVTTGCQNGFLADQCFPKFHKLLANGSKSDIVQEVLRLPVS